MKKIYYFIMLCLYVLGVVGGIGWSLYSGGYAYAYAVGVAALGFMAWPKFKDYLLKIMM